MKILLIIGILIPGLLFAQTNADSLENLLKTTQEDTNRITLLNKLSKIFSRKNLQKSISYSKQALELATKLNYKKGMAIALKNGASAYGFSGEHPKAIDYALQSLKLGEELQNDAIIRGALYSLGYTYLAMEENEKALATILRIEKIARKSGDKQKIAIALQHLGIAYNELGEYEKVIEYCTESLKIKQQIGDDRQTAYSLGMLGVAYRNLHQPEKAIEYFLQALERTEANNDKFGTVYGLCDIGITYRELGQYQKSLTYLQRTLRLAREIHYTNEMITVYEELSKTYEKMNHHAPALDYYKQFKVLSDSLYNTERSRQIAEMEAKYEVERKEKEQKIAILKKDKTIHDLNLKQQIAVRNFLIAGLLLVLIIVALLYFLYHSKKRAMKNELSKNIQLQKMNQALNHEIYEHKQTSEALNTEKERLSVTLRSIGEGVITTNIEGNVVLLNKMAENLTGWGQANAVGKPCEKVFSILEHETLKPLKNPIKEVLEKDLVIEHTHHAVLISKDGTQRRIASSAAPIHAGEDQIIGVVLAFRDITEKQKLEEELWKARKLESLGTLAGGIAHDFNNVLTGILANISLAKMYNDEISGEVLELLNEAEKASYLARDLTQQLLTFSRGGEPVKKTTNVAELIKSSVYLALRGSNTRCEFAIANNLWPIEIDMSQFSQAINNIIINASQAMPEGGTIHIKLENLTVQMGGNRSLPLKVGKYIKIIIQDEGIGIPQDHLKKIFDPYFSTKQKGSGLGLATVYSIINRHRGAITAESDFRTGATFTIYLPASEKQVAPELSIKETVFTGTGKILVMDDEPVIRKVADNMLKKLGYEAHFTTNGADAIQAYKEAQATEKPFDVVILDLTIPGGMGGKRTVEELLKIDPQVKAIVSSGYSNDPIMANFEKYGFHQVIKKPFVLQTISEVLHRVLTEK